MNTLRRLVKSVADTGRIPLKDGASDALAIARRESIDAGGCRSLRAETGPTEEEIRRGDHTRFPWERYRGDGKLEGPPFPLLWERKPDDDGNVIVALSDGSVRLLGRAELDATLPR